MKHRVYRVMCAALIVPALASPARAESPGSLARTSSLATLSPASLRVLSATVPAASTAAQGAAASDRPFLKTGKGAAAIALMVAGTAFTVWSINHDRKPVKSPIR